MTAPVRSTRNSSVEGLRIAAIVAITLMHMAGYVYGTRHEANTLLVIVLNTFGNMGVTLFMLISGYYGIRFSVRKGLALWGMVWLYSVVSYLVTHLGEGAAIQGRDWLPVLLPVCGRRFWFMTYYLIIFCLSPWLNRAKDLPRHSFAWLLGVLAAFYLLAPTLLVGDIDRNGGKGLANLILVYLTGQYLRTYGFPQAKGLTPARLFTAASACILLSGIVIERLTHHVYIPWGRDNSLFIVAAACGLLFMALRRPRTSRTVNYLAGFALPLYLQNELLLTLLHSQYAPLVNDPGLWLPFVVTAGEVVVAAFFVESVRRLLCRPWATPLLNRIEAWTQRKIRP